MALQVAPTSWLPTTFAMTSTKPISSGAPNPMMGKRWETTGIGTQTLEVWKWKQNGSGGHWDVPLVPELIGSIVIGSLGEIIHSFRGVYSLGLPTIDPKALGHSLDD